MNCALRSRYYIGVLALLCFSQIQSPPAIGQQAAAPAAVKKDDSADAERRRFLGTWKVVTTEFAGDDKNPRIRTAEYVHFSEREIVTWFGDTKVGKFFDGYVIDERAEPKRLSMHELVSGTTAVYPSIYRWEGERLRTVWTDQAVPSTNRDQIDRRRPKEFKTRKYKPTEFMLLLERVKDDNIEIPKRPEM